MLGYCRADGTALITDSGSVTYVDLGDKDKAFAELNKAYEIRLSSLCWLKVEPQMDPLRSDPRYQQLLHKMNFPQ